jgi:DNA-binding IclR family transcriptional regulator
VSQKPQADSTLGRVISVLDAAASGRGVVSRGYIARRTGLPKATANRIVAQLISAQLLEPQQGGVGLGIRVFEWGMRAGPTGIPLREVSLPHLEDLYEITHGHVQLAVRDDLEVVYLHKISGNRSIPMATRAGGRAPLHCTGSGKVLLAFAPTGILPRLILERGLQARTSRSITDGRVLEDELSLIRDQRYAIDNEEFARGIRSVAAPITYQGEVVAAVSISGDAHRLSASSLTPALRATTAAINRSLGLRSAGVGTPVCPAHGSPLPGRKVTSL